MDTARARLLREVLAGTAWVDRTRDFARTLRRSTDHGDGLLLVGTPDEEPWHLAAHLDDESRYAGLPTLSPTLVRWSPPPGAPAHLAIGLDRLRSVTRGETLFVVAPDDPTEQLLERVADVKRAGATILTMDSGDPDLTGLAHEQLIVPPQGLAAPGEPSGLSVPTGSLLEDLDLTAPSVSFDAISHLVSVAAIDVDMAVSLDDARRAGVRDRIARLLDRIQGPSSSHDW